MAHHSGQKLGRFRCGAAVALACSIGVGACVTQLTKKPGVISTDDVVPLRVEVLQALGARLNTTDPAIPLVAAKETLVRVYVTVTATEAPLMISPTVPRKVSVSLQAFRGGEKLPSCTEALFDTAPQKDLMPIVVASSASNLDLAIMQASAAVAMTDDLGATFNFTLPVNCPWTAAGDVTLRATVSGAPQCGTCKSNDVQDTVVTFHETRPVRVKLVLVHYDRDGSPNQGKAALYSTFGLDYLTAMYPTSGVELLPIASLTTTKDLDMYTGHDPSEGFGDWWTDYGKLRDDVYYVYKPLDGGTAGSPDVVLAILHKDVVGCWGISTLGVAVSGEGCGGTYAHEIGHAFGLCHASNSHGESDGGTAETPWPYPHGRIVGHGWNPGAPAKLITPGGSGWHSHDAMSYGACPGWAGYSGAFPTYCANWFSPLNYGRIAQRLVCGDPWYEGPSLNTCPKVPFNALLGPGTATTCGGGLGVHTVSSKAEAVPSSEAESLIVAGRIVDDMHVELRPFYRRLLAARPRRDGEGPFRLELQTAAGRVLYERQFRPLPTFAHIRGSVGLIDEVVPWKTGTSRIVIKRGDQILGDRSVSANPPTVSLLSPKGGGTMVAPTGRLAISWTASDADGDAVAYWVEYSADGGTTWETLARDLTETTYRADLVTLRGSPRAAIRVLATDGVNTAASMTAFFSVPSKAPMVSIMHPRPDTRFAPGEPVTLKALGTDQEDGQLPDSALSWNSDRDGGLGTGHALTLTRLTAGEHTITVTGIDRQGQRGTASLRIIIR